MTEVLGALSGSREPDPSCTGSGPSGFDPARIGKYLRYNSMSDDIARSVDWLTDEDPPRYLRVVSTALVDPDVFVAVSGSGERYWIVKSSGFVCGLGKIGVAVHAHPASEMEARQGRDAQRLDGEATTARPDAPKGRP
jgi:hypothetical protein